MAIEFLKDLPTPSLLLEESILQRNLSRLQARADQLGVNLRPHLKTAKSVDVAKRLVAYGAKSITVSTLKEAEVFADAGIHDIIYAVGISPDKLDRVIAIRERGCDLKVVLDSTDQAESVAVASQASGDPIPALIEIDCDGHRSGLKRDEALVVEIARRLIEGGAAFHGVLTHAGESYSAAGSELRSDLAEQERAAVVDAAAKLQEAGISCSIISVGSTPTAHAARDLAGVTEMRAGVYMFFDLVMAGLGVCSTDDIALSVLTTVIGHQSEKGWIIVDAGWMAMSRDRGTAAQAVDQGYGLVCTINGEIIPDLVMQSANQEHGILAVRPNSSFELPDLPVGSKVRILPNHACATAAQFDGYHVIPGNPQHPSSYWQRFHGW